jgi:hypothetical protein
MADPEGYVPLLDVLKAVQTHHSVDDETAQNEIVRGHQLGELDLVIRRPDGRIEDLSRQDDVWGVDPYQGRRLIFDEGLVSVPQRMPRHYRRRVSPNEICKVFGVRENLNSFLKVEGPRQGAPEQYDWEDALLFMHQLLNKRDDPLLSSAREGWSSDRDVGKAVQAYILKRKGKEPDISTVMKRIRPELKKWREGRKA